MPTRLIRTIPSLFAASFLAACASKDVRPDESAASPSAEPSSAARPLKPEPPLEGTEWRLVEWNEGESVKEGENVTLAVNEDKFVGRAACNRYFVPFHDGSEAGELSIGQGGATKMMCDPVSMEAESRFLQLLPKVTRYEIRDGKLSFVHPDGRLLFEPDEKK